MGENDTAVPAAGYVVNDAAYVGWAGSADTAGSATGSANNGRERSVVTTMVQTRLSCSVSP